MGGTGVSAPGAVTNYSFGCLFADPPICLLHRLRICLLRRPDLFLGICWRLPKRRITNLPDSQPWICASELSYPMVAFFLPESTSLPDAQSDDSQRLMVDCG